MLNETILYIYLYYNFLFFIQISNLSWCPHFYFLTNLYTRKSYVDETGTPLGQHIQNQTCYFNLQTLPLCP